ncbi:MAG: NADH-quinone oxidoreductase subunit A [Desulfobacterota bacterium]|nr:NADH-quinone oxidoreductase subunit A [Thermodesulfobacteriota bacterium]MDW8001848.1 NADH-quinone oxidoreductase subunit A [Deltaproteobacteria bacterium]
MKEYFGILVIFVIASFIAILIVGLSHFLGERKIKKVKLSPYECGMTTIGPARRRISVKYYIFAMLFLIFDIEVLFMYPWAVIAKGLKLFGFIEMLVFIFILFAGYAYVWKKGALEWE